MESLDNLTVEQLKKLLKQKGEELQVICAKLTEAGAADVIPDDILDQLW
ncbi:MAG: hypothetical protein J5835_06625 [Bacteroidales bacterium]|nr:hypothetical protein [Bacteroidales bacterium]